MKNGSMILGMAVLVPVVGPCTGGEKEVPTLTAGVRGPRASSAPAQRTSKERPCLFQARNSLPIPALRLEVKGNGTDLNTVLAVCAPVTSLPKI